MARVRTQAEFRFQQNRWGAPGGQDAQRTDLWYLDLTLASLAIQAQVRRVPVFSNLADFKPYELQSLVLPELAVKPESARRDSRNYQVPGVDEPLGAIKMTFLVDSNPESVEHNLITTLIAWRALVRAGRGSVSTESSFALNTDYRITYAFGATLHLLRGGSAALVDTQVAQAGSQAQVVVNTAPPGANFQGQPALQVNPIPRSPLQVDGSSIARPAWQLSTTRTPVVRDFERSYSASLINLWLGAFRITDLNHASSELLKVDATFYADDIRWNKSGQDYALPGLLAVGEIDLAGEAPVGGVLS